MGGGAERTVSGCCPRGRCCKFGHAFTVAGPRAAGDPLQSARLNVQSRTRAFLVPSTEFKQMRMALPLDVYESVNLCMALVTNTPTARAIMEGEVQHLAKTRGVSADDEPLGYDPVLGHYTTAGRNNAIDSEGYAIYSAVLKNCMPGSSGGCHACRLAEMETWIKATTGNEAPLAYTGAGMGGGGPWGGRKSGTPQVSRTLPQEVLRARGLPLTNGGRCSVSDAEVVATWRDILGDNVNRLFSYIEDPITASMKSSAHLVYNTNNPDVKKKSVESMSGVKKELLYLANLPTNNLRKTAIAYTITAGRWKSFNTAFRSGAVNAAMAPSSVESTTGAASAATSTHTTANVLQPAFLEIESFATVLVEPTALATGPAPAPPVSAGGSLIVQPPLPSPLYSPLASPLASLFSYSESFYLKMADYIMTITMTICGTFLSILRILYRRKVTNKQPKSPPPRELVSHQERLERGSPPQSTRKRVSPKGKSSTC